MTQSLNNQNEPKIEKVLTTSLIPYARNSKRHDDRQISMIASSIKEFGFNNPVLIDAENGIIAGHGRVLAAQRLDLPEVPCIRLGHLSEAQKRAYVIADNRLAEIGGGWDEEMLKIELADLSGSEEVEVALTGYTEDEVKVLLDGWTPDFKKVDQTEENLDGIEAKIILGCPQEKRAEYVEDLKEWLLDKGFTDIIIK